MRAVDGNLLRCPRQRRRQSGEHVLPDAFLGFQAERVNRSLVDIDTRQFQNTYVRSAILDIKRESESLLRHIQAQKLNNPRVSLIAQGRYTVEYNLAQYFGIKSRREGDYFSYTPVRPYSWGEKKANAFMNKTTRENLISWWKDFDVIWPIKTDPWIRNILAGLISSPKCINNPEQFFLFNTSGGTFTCLPKQHPAEVK